MKPFALSAALALFAAPSLFAATVTINIDGQSTSYTLNSLSVDASGNATVSASGGSPPPTQYTLSTFASPSAGGSVTGAGTYNAGATATVSATAASGYTFSSWTGCASSTSTCTLTMDANKSVTATFTPNGGGGPGCTETDTLKCVDTGVSATAFAKKAYNPLPAETYAFSFTTPASGSYSADVVATRTTAADASKLIVISATPGDIALSDKDRGCFGYATESTTVYYVVNQSETAYSRKYFCHLQPGTKYYFNVASKNYTGTATCTTSSNCGYTFTAR